MTIEEAIKELEEKYREDFNWAIISDSKIFFVNELKSELSNDDVVKNADVIALARKPIKPPTIIDHNIRSLLPI